MGGVGKGAVGKDLVLRDGPLENLSGGGGRAKYKKRNSLKGKLNEKKYCTPINPKKYSCYGLTKIHTRNLIRKTYSCGSKIPLPPSPITFLMVGPLKDIRIKGGIPHT